MSRNSAIPQSIEQKDLEKTVLNVFDKTDALVDLQNFEACDRLKSDDDGSSNLSLCSYSKYFCSKYKVLWSGKLLSSIWVSNSSLPIKLGNA